MKNIFKKAYFGKLYKTRDGRKAIYIKYNKDSYDSSIPHQLICEDGGSSIQVDDNGSFWGIKEKESVDDIVSEWKADYDEVRNKAIDSYINSPNIGEDPLKWYTEGYFGGYKEHMEINFD